MPERLLKKDWWWKKVDNVSRIVYFVVILLSVITISILYGLIVHEEHKISFQQNEIQTERAASVRRSCEDQNNRHDRTIHQLHVIVKPFLKQVKSNPVKVKQLQASIKANILLIDALAPRQNCNFIVKLATSPRVKPEG